MLNVVVAADQFVDQLVALGFAVALVFGKLDYILGGRRQAGQVKVDAAQEFLIGGNLGWQCLGTLKLGCNKFINLVVGWHVFPFEAGAISHHGHDGGGVGPLEPGKHRRLATTGSGHQAAFVGRGNVGVAGLDE